MPHRSRKSPTILDPRGLFVFDTRPLGRRPGAVREETRTVAVPDGLRVGLSDVPAGAAAEMAVQLESVTEGVLVTATTTVPVAGECARCLDPLALAADVTVQELYRYDLDPDDADEGDFSLDGSLLDMEQAFRDAVVLALPPSPLCSVDCPGLCARCGARLADVGVDHYHDEGGHPAWEVLRQLDR